MKKKLDQGHVRTGEERALKLFEEQVTGGGRWVVKKSVMRFRGTGRVMVNSVYAVARHVEGAKLSKALAKRGVDTVSLSSVRTALRKLGNGLLNPETRISRTGARFARYITRSEPARVSAR
jgi:hypothetical protein